jgi:hypothetical protein
MFKIKGRYTKHFRKKVAFLTFYETINFNVFFIKTVLKELYYNFCVFACPVAPEDGTGVTLWLNYYLYFRK